MRVLLRFLAISSVALLMATPAQAARNTAYDETYHVGLSAGNLDGGTEYGSVSAQGFMLAARNKKASLEYVKMSSDTGDIASSGNQWEANLSGFYLALIGEGQPYMKLKVGKLKHEMVTIAGGTTTAETNSVTSYGLGLGYKLGSRMMLELDITTLDKDMTLFTLNLLF